MAKLNAKILAAVTLAAVTLTTPALTHANDFAGNSQYDFCKQADGENQLLGGLVGAVAGGVIGSQVAGRGDRTEGSLIGAALGGGLGAVIADDRRNCSALNQPLNQRGVTSPVQRSFNNSGSFNTGISGYSGQAAYIRPQIQTVNFQASNRGLERRLDRIDYQIDQLRYELEELRQRRRFNNSRFLERRIYDVGCELDELKLQKKLLKKQARSNNRSFQSRGFF